MNNKKYLILFICTIIIICIVFASIMIFTNINNDENKVKNKVDEEMSYIEIKLIGMINSLNNIPFSDGILLEQTTVKSSNDDSKSESEDSKNSENTESENYTKYNVESQNILIGLNKDINWNYIKNSIEELYDSWTTIMIDLHSINVQNEDILKFSNQLDNLILNIQKEDKRLVLTNLSTLYSYIPIYISQYSDDNTKINISYTKSNIINSYVLVEDSNWDEMQAQIMKAQEYFGLIINSINIDNNQSIVNKTYILLNEMKNVISLQDKTLYYLKYKNLMENAMSI